MDLFAGAGGLSLGLEQAGFDVTAAVEYDPIHCAVHSYNFPRTETICANISNVTSREIRVAVRSGLQQHGQDLAAWDGEIDVVAGGPPCQGFSTMGKRLVDDKRNRLVFEFFRLVSELAPRYFLMENVPGMLAGGHRTAILDRLIDEFKRVGYQIVQPVRVLNAASFGVPQDRRRLFLVGAREDMPLPIYPDPVTRPVAKRPRTSHVAPAALWPGLPMGPSVWDAIGDLPDADRFVELIGDDEIRLPRRELSLMTSSLSMFAKVLRGDAEDPTDLSHQREWDPALLTSSMRTIHSDLTTSRFQNTAPGESEPISHFYRLRADGLCSAIRAGTGSERGAFTSPRPIHPTLPRVLTVREAARLHSFPDWFRLHRTKWHGFRQVGNAVPPRLARYVAGSLATALDVEAAPPLRPWPPGSATLLGFDMSEAIEHFGAEREYGPQTRTQSRLARPDPDRTASSD